MRISPETQARVRKAAADLGYRPNLSARSLRTGTTKTIGLISDHIASGHFASQMLSGASSAAAESGRLLLIGETGGTIGIESGLVEEMVDREVDGLIYAALSTCEVTLPPVLANQRVVLLNCVDPTLAKPAVLPDEESGGRTAAMLLAESGVERFQVLGRDPKVHTLSGRLRTQGVQGALADLGLPPAEVIACDWDVVPAHDALDDWLERGGRPGGLVCLNDRVAMGAYAALSNHGLRVPSDVPVVSFDGSELASWLRPSLTSVVVPYAELGAHAVRLLMQQEPTQGRPGAHHGTRRPPAGSPDVHRLPMPVREGGSVRASGG